MLYALIALVSAIAAAVSLFLFQRDGNTSLLIVGIICVLLTVIFGIIFMSGRINKTEDIHITE